MEKIRNLYILTIVYAIGIVIFLLTGLCEINWVFYVAILLGVIGLGYNIYKHRTR